ncbi:hypothetical protein [Gemmatimonas sp.]|jgi:hypothetical protein|uniref:hypothetical protein n=1 Tax=Gemmatimonas sp. TaxID=1962908 RepID=UPI0037BEFB9B
MLTPDSLQSEREAMVKAEANAAHYAEAIRRATAAAEYELVAPLAERHGPLPERLPTVQYLTPEDQQLYKRDMDGSWVLSFVRINDVHSVTAHTDRIGKTLHVLGEDETPTSRLAQQHRQREMEAKVSEYLVNAERKAAEDQLAREETQLRAQMAQLEAERERIRRERKPGGITRDLRG